MTILIKGLVGDENFSVDISADPTPSPELTNHAFTIGGVNYIVDRVNGQANDVTLDITHSSLLTGVTFTSNIPSIVHVNALGKVTYKNTHVDNVSDEYEIIVKSPVAGSKKIRGTAEYTGRVVSYTLDSYAEGTLSHHITQAVEAMINGLTAKLDETQVYITSNNGNVDDPAIVRNPDNFAASLDMSAMAVIRGDEVHTGFPERYPVCLISERHVIMAHHTLRNMDIGTKIVFCSADGLNYQTVQIAGISEEIPTTDIAVCYLAEKVTVVEPVQLMPHNWIRDYAPTVDNTELEFGAVMNSIPSICKRAHNHLTQAESWININAVKEINFGTQDFVLAEPVWTNMGDWWDEITAGDSGGCLFFPIYGKAVLITSTESTSFQTDYSDFINEINTIMNDQAGVVAGTYEVSQVDLSQFEKFT